MTVITEAGAAKLADLVKQVQAGNDVLLTEDDKPARMVAAPAAEAVEGVALRIGSLKAHRVLTPVITQSDVAKDLFGQS